MTFEEYTKIVRDLDEQIRTLLHKKEDCLVTLNQSINAILEEKGIKPGVKVKWHDGSGIFNRVIVQPSLGRTFLVQIVCYYQTSTGRISKKTYTDMLLGFGMDAVEDIKIDNNE